MEFTCEAIWPWAFVLREIFNHSFNFSVSYCLVHNYYFFLVQSWIEGGRTFLKICPFIFSRLSIFLAYSDLLYFCIVWCIWRLFSLHMFVFLIVSFSCSWHLILLHCGQKRCLEWFQFFEFTKARFMAQDMIYPAEGSMCTWETGKIHCFRVKCPIDIN